MKPSMLQRQVTEPVDVFRRVLVYGDPQDAVRLLRQSLPLIANAADIHLLEPAGGRGSDASLDGLLLRLERNGAQVKREIVDGGDSAAILQGATRGHDLVLKATAPGGASETALDVLDRELLARCPCTVWFGRYGRAVTPRRIAAAVDSRGDDERDRLLSGRVLALGDALATATGAELHVVHAWFLFGAEVLKSHASEDELARSVAAAGARARQRLSVLLRTLPQAPLEALPQDRMHAIQGAPERALPRFVNTRKMDLAVIATRSRRSRLVGSIFPSVAGQLLTRTWCSVVVVRRSAAERLETGRERTLSRNQSSLGE